MSMITSVEELRSLYDPPKENVVKKDIGHIDRHCRRFIAYSPFVVIASYDQDGAADASPRGGHPGFVKVADDHTLLLPDWGGNNRLDTFSNILSQPEIGLLFMIPGVNETLRVNGRAELHSDEGYRSLCSEGEKLPKLVLKLSVREAYLHCAKAIMRASLWEPESRIDRTLLPSAGQIVKDQLRLDIEPETLEAMTERYRKNLY